MSPVSRWRAFSLFSVVLFGIAMIALPANASKAETKYWFTQVLDHFNNSDFRTFQQKYYILDTYWDAPKGPIILYINGEAPCTGSPNNWVLDYAKNLSARIITLEHRYYGESQPFKRLSTANLEYLSSKQAIEDTARFVQVFNAANTSESVGWFAVGCSYAGALSAWFRLKHPNLVKGSLSSSGVVHPILDYYEFDQQVAAAIPSDCADALRTLTSQIEQQLQKSAFDSFQTKAKFQAEYFEDDGDFYFLIADSQAESVQYGYQQMLCNAVVNVPTGKLIDAYANYMNNFWYPDFNGAGPASYSTAYQQVEDNQNSARAFWYQQCTELGWLQTAPKTGAIRSQYLTLKYFLDHCEKVFGQAMVPRVAETNEYYGGAKIAGTKIYFANSSQDPWQTASVVQSPDPQNEPAQLVVCGDCGHCSDLRGCPSLPSTFNLTGCDNMNPVWSTRAEIQNYMNEWIFGDSGKK